MKTQEIGLNKNMAKYKMSPLIKKYYESWLNGPALFDHPNDEERFYRFTKACLRYGRKHLNGQWLRYFLRKDLLEKYDDEYAEYQIQNAISLFDHLMDFSRVSFPDHVLEMRNPYLSAEGLRSILRRDRKPRYSEEEIHNILNNNFGAGWENKKKMFYGNVNQS